VWGIPAHPAVASALIPQWCARVALERNFERFRELLGSFVVIIDEPRQQRLSFVSDILGVRPLFVAERPDGIYFGSDVWALRDAGLSTGAVNYDAVAAWVAYGYNCSNGSLFAGVDRVPAGSVVVFEQGRRTEFLYGALRGGCEAASAEQTADELHHIVSSTVKTLLAEQARINIALSGGYDSRYLLALCLRHMPASAVTCTTIDLGREGEVARQVAATLRVAVDSIPVARSEWDLYDDVHHFGADGFPISKFVTHCIAQRYQHMPMVNGFMGDSLIRGSHDTFLGQHETNWPPAELAGVLQRKHMTVSFSMFRGDFARRLGARSRIPMDAAVERGGAIGKVFSWTDLFYRQRCYISNNFLQHLDDAEALLPFYSWDLLQYKLSHQYRVFDHNIYRTIFERHCPALVAVPHSSELPPPRHGRSRIIRRWAGRLVRDMSRPQALTLLAKRHCALVATACAFGYRDVESAVMTMQRLHLFERRAAESRLDFDWDAV